MAGAGGRKVEVEEYQQAKTMDEITGVKMKKEITAKFSNCIEK